MNDILYFFLGNVTGMVPMFVSFVFAFSEFISRTLDHFIKLFCP